MIRRGSGILGVTLSVWAAPAAAEEVGRDSGRAHPLESPPASWYLPVGFNFGALTGAGRELGTYFGGEVSLARLDQSWMWWGGYLDGSYDFGTGDVLASAGVEWGYRTFGFDAGYLVELGAHGEQRHGIALRPLLTTGLVSLTLRGAVFLGPGSTGQRGAVELPWLGQLGLLVKYPLDLDG